MSSGIDRQLRLLGDLRRAHVVWDADTDRERIAQHFKQVRSAKLKTEEPACSKRLTWLPFVLSSLQVH
jgi:hypothetical protein